MFIDFTKFIAFMILFGFLWNLTRGKLATGGGDAGRFEKAMAFIYN
jgi:hypothetical protein